MARAKRIYVLLGILAAVCIATVWVMRTEQHKEQIKNSDEIVLTLSEDSVQTLSWDYQGETLAFHRTDGVWLYDGDEDFPVDEEAVGALLDQFGEFGVSFVIEGVEDYGQYGLDAPVCTIRLATEEQSYEISLGNYSSMDSQRYVSIGDGNVYLVKHDPLDEFDAVLSDMIAHDRLPALDSVTKLQFAGAQAYTILYQEDSTASPCADDVYFTQQGGSELPLDTDRVNSYLSQITGLGLTDYVTYHVSEEELEGYGLASPQLTVTVDYTAQDEDGQERGETFVLHVGRDPEELAAAGDEEETVTAYARVGDSQIIYRLSSDDYQALMAASYDDLRHREVFTADFGDINQIDITLEGAAYTITAQGEGEKRVYSYQDEELDLTQLQSALEGLSADSFLEEQPTQKQEISLVLHLDSDTHPQITIELYRYDGAYCLAAVDGTPVSLVQRALVVELVEAVNAIVLS